MEAISLISLVALMKKVVDTLKFITNKNASAFVTQLCAWAIGVGIVWLSTLADITERISIFGTTFNNMNFGSIVLGGMIFASTASVIYDYQAARDNTDSAVTPPLLPVVDTTTTVRGRM